MYLVNYLFLIGYFHLVSLSLYFRYFWIKCGFLLIVIDNSFIVERDPERNPCRGVKRALSHLAQFALDSCLIFCSHYHCEWPFLWSVKLLSLSLAVFLLNHLRHPSVFLLALRTDRDLDELSVADVSHCSWPGQKHNWMDLKIELWEDYHAAGLPDGVWIYL